MSDRLAGYPDLQWLLRHIPRPLRPLLREAALFNLAIADRLPRRRPDRPMVEGPHDAAGSYTCECGKDRRGLPYNRRSVLHAHRRHQGR